MTEVELSGKTTTRDEILQAAHTLFMENGFHGTSMRQIAQRTGLAVGGIYNHFASKEQIFTTIFLELHPYREFLEQMNAAQGETVDELLHDAARRLNTALVGPPEGFLKLMFIELVEFQALHVQELFQQILPQLLTLGQRFFVNRPEMRDLPPLIILRAFLGLFFSYIMTEWLIAGYLPDEARQDALQYFVDIYLHGVLKTDVCGDTA